MREWIDRRTIKPEDKFVPAVICSEWLE